MNANALLKELFQHMEWADALIWSTILRSPSLAHDKVIQDRLHHLHLVQWLFLHIWRNEVMDFNASQDFSEVKLAKWGCEYHSEVSKFIASIKESQLDVVVSLPWASKLANELGSMFTNPLLGETLLQVPSHSTHHRGQVNVRIRELQIVPPLTDFIAWVWLGKPAAKWEFGME
jgi:uncharacterized damage-inducible protein DinB